MYFSCLFGMKTFPMCRPHQDKEIRVESTERPSLHSFICIFLPAVFWASSPTHGPPCFLFCIYSLSWHHQGACLAKIRMDAMVTQGRGSWGAHTFRSHLGDSCLLHWVMRVVARDLYSLLLGSVSDLGKDVLIGDCTARPYSQIILLSTSQDVFMKQAGKSSSENLKVKLQMVLHLSW